jgi:periplasmic protein TonB
MERRLFEDLVESDVVTHRTRKGLTVPVSFGFHATLAILFFVVPLLFSHEMPEVASTSLRAFFAEPQAAPPPPPPPPPPAPRAANAPRVTQVAPATSNSFTAPINVPDTIRPDDGMDLGVEGGVDGGVEGGVAGGVVGGIVGGLPAEAPQQVAPVRVGGQIKEPKKLKNVAPVYPPIARQARVQGQVVLECTISPQGRVTNVKVVKGIPLLDTSAIEAVRQWVYTPTLLNGVPVPVIMTVTVNFTIS